MSASGHIDGEMLVERIQSWAHDHGFQKVGIADLDISADFEKYREWLERGFQGSMSYLERNLDKRANPRSLHPGTLSIISLRADYLTESIDQARAVLEAPETAYVSRYALGRDYHKTLRQRLRAIGQKLAEEIAPHGYRVFTDSAPVAEKPLARNAGLGWIGKHTNLVDPQDGSLFFIGEIFTDLALPTAGNVVTDHCGSCTRCLEVCPTNAFTAPYVLDARRCISYLTIESKQAIPEPLRPLIGNRIFGCDDCQLVCPWNRYAKMSLIRDFEPRHRLNEATLVELFDMTESEFDTLTRGSAIRRISHQQWLRNIAVALGNAPGSESVVAALSRRVDTTDDLVREHTQWALAQHRGKPANATT